MCGGGVVHFFVLFVAHILRLKKKESIALEHAKVFSALELYTQATSSAVMLRQVHST